jgi:hypothetical protein
MSNQVFDKATLENEIIANKDKARERRRSIERMMLEERMLNQRMEYVDGVVEKTQLKRDRKYKKMVLMVLKAFSKKMVKERMMEHMCE